MYVWKNFKLCICHDLIEQLGDKSLLSYDDVQVGNFLKSIIDEHVYYKTWNNYYDNEHRDYNDNPLVMNNYYFKLKGCSKTYKLKVELGRTSISGYHQTIDDYQIYLYEGTGKYKEIVKDVVLEHECGDDQEELFNFERLKKDFEMMDPLTKVVCALTYKPCDTFESGK